MGISFVKVKNNITIYGYDGEYIFETLLSTENFYEIALLEQWTPLLGTPKTILDIGANLGNHSLYWASQLKPEKIYSFEPYPANFELLARNIDINSYSQVVWPVKKGVGNQAGYAVVKDLDESNLGGTTLAYAKEGVADQMEIVSIDSFVAENQILSVDFVKIDTEGFELMVLEGMKQTIQASKPDLWIEVSYATYQQVIEKLTLLGYVLKDITQYNLLFLHPDRHVNLSQYDHGKILDEYFKYLGKTNDYYQAYNKAKGWVEARNQQVQHLQQENAEQRRKLARITDTWYGRVFLKCYRKLQKIKRNEHTFYSEKEIRYIFEKSTQKSKYLVIVFSAFSPAGKPAEYNYYNTITKFDCNKLFILDDHGGDGCYYLGQERDFAIERSVIRLIENICTKYDIPRQNILTCGSSKGGYAALYFSIKYQFGHAVVCAPQTFLGDFLSSKIKTLKYIAGDYPDSKKFLNNILFEAVKDADRFPNIVIHVGKGDSHYKNHVIPLQKAIEKKGHNITLNLGDFANHNEISFYQKLLKQKIKEYILDCRVKKNWPDIHSLTTVLVTRDGFDFIEAVIQPMESDLLYAWYVFKDDIKIYTEQYKKDANFRYKVEAPGKYRIQVFSKNQSGKFDIDTSDYIIFAK